MVKMFTCPKPGLHHPNILFLLKKCKKSECVNYKVKKDLHHNNLSHVVRKPDFAYAKTNAQISFAVTGKLISAFVFATGIVQFLFFLNPKFQESSLLL